jgi:hypothetical protein
MLFESWLCSFFMFMILGSSGAVSAIFELFPSYIDTGNYEAFWSLVVSCVWEMFRSSRCDIVGIDKSVTPV